MGTLLSHKHRRSRSNDSYEEFTSKKQKHTHIKKILLLGAGMVGKSTIFKQLRTIHGNGWTIEDRLAFIDHIHAQIIEQMRSAIECIEWLTEEQLHEQYGDNYKEKHAAKLSHLLSYGYIRECLSNLTLFQIMPLALYEIIYTFSITAIDFNPFEQLSHDAQSAIVIMQSLKDPKLTAEIAAACKILWNEAEIKKIYEQRAIMVLQDSNAYFWNKIDRIAATGYCPDEMDILMVYYRTTGTIDQKFTIKNNVYHIFDTGGQKSERKKWIHCFEHVTAIIYVASLSSYDEIMLEDESCNAMVDQLELFDAICNNNWFEKTSMILFLNKKDLFIQKIAESKPITLCSEFEDYDGNPTSFHETISYIKTAFIQKNKSPDDKSIYVHLTCAIDQNNVKKVFDDVQHIIIQNSLMSVLV